MASERSHAYVLQYECQSLITIIRLSVSHVSKLSFDSQFVDSVKENLKLLDPVAKLTNKCQQSNFLAGDAVKEWVTLFEEGHEAPRPTLEYRCKENDAFNISRFDRELFSSKLSWPKTKSKAARQSQRL